METQVMKNFFYRMLCGAFLGISIIAPGVSGSVMAVMMGIYTDLINIVSNPFKNFKKNFIYLLPMGIGAVLSIAIFIQLLKMMFDNFPIPTFLMFIGLIAGSLPTVFKEANVDGFKKRYIIAILSALTFAVTIGMLARFKVSVSADTTNIFYFSASGLIAGISSMIPGMSISMVLMMLGVYTQMLEATSNFEIITMLPVAICFAIGMVSFSSLTKYIFKVYHNFGYFMVFGFMIGSIISIFPGLPKGLLNWVLSIIMIFLGLGISFIFQALGKKFNTSEA